MTPEESIVLQRAMRLVGYTKTLKKEYQTEMQAIDDKYLMRIQKVLDSMTDRDRLFFQQNKKTTRAAQLRKLLDDWTREYRDTLKAKMSDSYDNVFKIEHDAVEGEKVQEAETPPRLILGATIPAIAATSALRYRKYVDGKVKQAFADGFEVGPILRGRAKLKFRDGVVWTRDSSAAAHLGNTVMTASHNGRVMAYIEQDRDRLRWVATLDGRTCFQCASLDGTIFKVGEHIEPPAHGRCRCQAVPVEEAIGQRGALEDKTLKRKGNPDRINPELKPASMTFKKWFPTTSTRFQREYLGDTRYKLWKQGKLKFDQFTDKYGRDYTLEDLNDVLALRA